MSLRKGDTKAGAVKYSKKNTKKSSRKKMTIQSIRYEVGNENFGHGRTSVRLTSYGEMEITNKRNLQFKTKLDEKTIEGELKNIFKIAATKKIKQTKTKKKGLPDERKISFSFDNKKIELWESELEKSTLNSLMKNIRKFVKDNTRGEMIV